MTNFLFPTISNKKGEAVVSLEDFKSLTPKKERKADLSYKTENRRFTIAPSFVEGRNEFTGFVPVIDQDTNKAYFLKSLTEETFATTTSVKGAEASRTFTSEVLEFAITNTGLSLEKPLYLSLKETVNGFEVYTISNEYSETSQDVNPTKPVELKPLEELNSTPLAETDYRFVGSNGFVDTPATVVDPEAQYVASQVPAVDEAIVADNSSLTDLI